MRATYGKPCFSALQKCCYSTQTSSKAAEKVRFSKEGAKVTRLSNGVNVASVETLSPVVHLAYVFNAGSRYETMDNLGITHCIRRASSLANKKYSNFGMVRNLQQIGATLTCITTREQVVYAVDCLRSQVPLALDILGNAALLPEFKPWEISDNNEYIKRDLLALEQDPESQVLDLLHKAAYRTTLGNPIYMPSHRVGKHSPQQLKQFTDALYGGSNLSIVVLGADHDSVMMINRRGELLMPSTPGSPVQPEKSKYHGGELRQENSSDLVHVAVASESVSLKAEEIAAVQVLEHIMGSSVRVKYGSGASKFAKAISASTKAPFMVRCLNYSYSDSGLFGFHLVTGKNEVGKALKAAAGAFSSAVKGGITEDDVKHAKARVKSELHFAKENAPTHAVLLGRQLGITGQAPPSGDALETIIDKVSLQDVQNLAKKILQSKASLAAVGDLRSTPHLDELRSS